MTRPALYNPPDPDSRPPDPHEPYKPRAPRQAYLRIYLADAVEDQRLEAIRSAAAPTVVPTWREA